MRSYVSRLKELAVNKSVRIIYLTQFSTQIRLQLLLAAAENENCELRTEKCCKNWWILSKIYSTQQLSIYCTLICFLTSKTGRPTALCEAVAINNFCMNYEDELPQLLCSCYLHMQKAGYSRHQQQQQYSFCSVVTTVAKPFTLLFYIHFMYSGGN